MRDESYEAAADIDRDPPPHPPRTKRPLGRFVVLAQGNPGSPTRPLLARGGARLACHEPPLRPALQSSVVSLPAASPAPAADAFQELARSTFLTSRSPMSAAMNSSGPVA